MKKIIVFCVAFLATMSLWASETSVENAYGVEIWYNFDNESKTASVTYKGDYSDKYTGEVVIPSTVTYKDEEYSVTDIGERAFDGCSSLTSITLPESVTEIANSAFFGCSSLTSIDVASNNNNYTSIDGVLFSKDKTILIQYPAGKDATSYIIPESVTEIGYSAFDGCSSLTSITIPEDVTEIGDYAFVGCRDLTNVTIPSSVSMIGYGAFGNCRSLKSIDVDWYNENYTSIDGVLFNKDETVLIRYPAGRYDSWYLIPESVTMIDVDAFSGCLSLTSITIPESVTEIRDYVFSGCSFLTSITCKNTTPPEIGYYSVDKSIPLYVPAESVEAYKNAEGWKEFTNIQAIPPSSVANAKAETQDFVRKEYRDGQVLIIKGDKTYTMFGTEY